MSNETCQNKKALQAGAALTIAGTLLLLDQLGFLPSHWFSFWAAVCFVVGILKIIQADQWAGRLWGAFVILLGVGLELDYTGYMQIELRKLWPLFVIGAGLGLLLRSLERPHPPVESSDRLNLFSVMGGGEYRVRGNNFRGGCITAVLGGFQLDLTEASMEGNEATIEVNTILGGGEIRVPDTWAVVMRASTLAGGYSMKAREGARVEKTLVVKGMSILGGVEIKN